MNKIYMIIGLMVCSVTQSFAAEIKQLSVSCDKTSLVVATLAQRFKEITILAGTGIGPQANHIISVWGNPELKTYTILDTFGDMSCILSVGENIEILLQEPEPNGPKI